MSLLRRLRSAAAQARELPRVWRFIPVLVRALLHPTPLASPAFHTSEPSIARAPGTRDEHVDGGVVAFSIIRNGITNGYPFVEAYGSWLDTCSRIVILDGESDDGTREALDALAEIDSRVGIESAPWPASTAGGSAIAEFTNRALDLARPHGETLVYLQADEIYPQPQRRLAAKPRGRALEFAGCVNFWNSFDTVVANEFPMRYVRAFPASASIVSIADGFSFDLGGLELERTPEEILHYGWCFPVNILQKHVSHARLYRDNAVYRSRGFLARAMLRAGSTDRRLLAALAPGYRPAPFTGSHPPAVRHLLGMAAYDPRPGLDLLAAGAAW